MFDGLNNWIVPMINYVVEEQGSYKQLACEM